MAETHVFELNIMSINGVFFNDKVRSVVVPCLDGSMQICAHHEEMWLAIYEGEIRIETREGEWVTGICGVGSLQFANNRCMIVADTVEKPEDIDYIRAKEAAEIAQERIRQKNSIAEYKMSQAALARALNRMKAASSGNRRIGGLD
ncbi:FoF1 ATP synthase subunit delta/epsilon [Butyrivibrio sp. MC2013]|uniref:FoF1 ATP synthase subunit delta/epsilon n=1 Tax=Butyrivibrio sp. MC2013 TaxID=1280686 RepID=UPI00040733E2|nr:F0F1 ATP synthase subunit epsilon [Butyrivibrio sp. MC2013]